MFNQPTQFDKIEKWVRFIRDIAVLIGFPVLITVGISLSNLQKQALNEQVELLKLGQADRAWTILEAKEKLYREELSMLSDSVAIKDSIISDLNKFRESLLNFTYHSEYDIADSLFKEALRIRNSILLNLDANNP